MNATFPFASLTVDEVWARLGGFFDVWIPRNEVLEVESVPAFLSGAIRFKSTTGEFDGVIYWTFSANDVLATFARFGWPTSS